MKEQEKSLKTRKSVFTALFAAIICAGAIIRIPLGPFVPVVIQNMFAVLAGALLGPLQGAGAVGLFLVAGAIGLPVFSGGRGGFPVLLGPTGGFLIGYFFAAIVTGLILKKPDTEAKTPLITIILGCLLGFIVLYVPGVLRLQYVMGKGTSLLQALSAGVIPFLPGDLLKLCLSVPLAVKLRPVIARYLDDGQVSHEIKNVEKK